jgi:F-type H+-transporting ATPase subunit alpha
LNRGARLTELLKQPQFDPLTVEKQVAILFAGVNGLLDDVEVADLRAFEDGFYPYLENSAPTILTDIATKKALDDDIKKRLTDAVKDYKTSFLANLKDKREASEKELAATKAADTTTEPPQATAPKTEPVAEAAAAK